MRAGDLLPPDAQVSGRAGAVLPGQGARAAWGYQGEEKGHAHFLAAVPEVCQGQDAVLKLPVWGAMWVAEFPRAPGRK